ncbi:hypothetical protein AB0C28_42215 [Nonomuraea sp. NPDC048892]|uniref:hypothetical protein n=1 Tax=Nonomuraea sp. NPDC048892 TaxID=3154624 RepID=UPI0033D675D8
MTELVRHIPAKGARIFQVTRKPVLRKPVLRKPVLRKLVLRKLVLRKLVLRKLVLRHALRSTSVPDIVRSARIGDRTPATRRRVPRS